MDFSCGGDLFFQGKIAGWLGHGVITIDHGLLPTLIGSPGMLVAVVIGVTVFEVLLTT
jgi:hypothetical protein